jgi:hypothetical protein
VEGVVGGDQGQTSGANSATCYFKPCLGKIVEAENVLQIGIQELNVMMKQPPAQIPIPSFDIFGPSK